MNIYCVINPRIHNFIIILNINIKCNSFTSSMDDLSVALNSSGIGGNLGDAFLNHLCYNDDICLISLSSDNVVTVGII